MTEKILFKTAPISYSRFLKSKQSKETHVHWLTEAKETVDIEFFRQSISLHYQHAYATKKWQNWVYRFVFFSFGLLFLLLSGIIFFKTVNFACGFYFKNCLVVKNCINSFCILLSGGAFTAGYSIHPEKEAIQYLIGKVEKELSHPAKHLQIEFNAIISNLFQDETASHQTVWIKKTLNR